MIITDRSKVDILLQYPELSKIFEVHAHKGDIDDVAISPANDKVSDVYLFSLYLNKGRHYFL